jgi:hypothetical protein
MEAHTGRGACNTNAYRNRCSAVMCGFILYSSLACSIRCCSRAVAAMLLQLGCAIVPLSYHMLTLPYANMMYVNYACCIVRWRSWTLLVLVQALVYQGCSKFKSHVAAGT